MKCSKCRKSEPTYRWHLCGPGGRGRHKCNDRDANKFDEEHMHYYCTKCGYDWCVKMDTIQELVNPLDITG